MGRYEWASGVLGAKGYLLRPFHLRQKESNEKYAKLLTPIVEIRRNGTLEAPSRSGPAAVFIDSFAANENGRYWLLLHRLSLLFINFRSVSNSSRNKSRFRRRALGSFARALFHLAVDTTFPLSRKVLRC